MSLSPKLVKELAQKYHTPLYVFEESVVRRQCRLLKQAVKFPNTTFRYACKALTLQAILKIVKDEGFWIDASSLNEVKRALLAGFEPRQILYTGESASFAIFKELVESRISINCSSIDQIRVLGEVAPGSKFSFRLNPGEGHGANNKVNTGGPASKHGVYFDQLDAMQKVVTKHGLVLNGLHTHVGSGTDLSHWLRINRMVLETAQKFKGLEFINLGGGLPVVYNPKTDSPLALETWGQELTDEFRRFCSSYGSDVQLNIEPGRFIVAECGSLLGEVQNIKRTPDFTFAIVNTGFTHNPRPAIYGSYHPIDFVQGRERVSDTMNEYVIAGNLCESGDVFTRSEDGTLLPRSFSELEVGDIMVMGLVGAYSHAMKSEYNSMNLPASVLVQADGNVRVIERRGTIEDIMLREVEAW